MKIFLACHIIFTFPTPVIVCHTSRHKFLFSLYLFLFAHSTHCDTLLCLCEYVFLYVHECTCVSMCTATELNWSESVACRVVMLFSDIISIVCPFLDSDLITYSVQEYLHYLPSLPFKESLLQKTLCCCMILCVA